MGRMLDAFTGYQAGRRRDGGTINEIDELEDATDLLFGEQQAQTNQHDRVKFKAQEQSISPCYKVNANSKELKQGEKYYFFQLNEICEF